MGNDLAVTTHPTGSNLCVGNAEYPKRYVIAIQYFSAEIPLHLIIEQADSHCCTFGPGRIHGDDTSCLEYFNRHTN
jgi:hypothetical protein